MPPGIEPCSFAVVGGLLRSAPAALRVFWGDISGVENGWEAVGFDEEVAGVACCAVGGGGFAGAAFGVDGTVATLRNGVKVGEGRRRVLMKARRQAAQTVMLAVAFVDATGDVELMLNNS